ncbi:MAG TPA: PAS domain S-box protein [Azospirillum sp.]|nr:PAS domain S-box protein [Azospirillum sp.]
MPRPWADWIGERLGRRIAVQAVAGILATGLLFATLALAGSVWLLRQEQADEMSHRLNLAAERLSAKLSILARNTADLAANPVMSTALLDSRGRDVYLRPFLGNYRLPLVEPHGITLCDFDGQPLASRKDVAPECRRGHPAVAEMFRTERPQLVIPGPGERPEVVILQPVLYPGTGRAEGYVAATLDLEALLAGVARDGGNTFLRLTSDAAGLDVRAGAPPAEPAAALSMPVALEGGATLRLRLEERLSMPEGLLPLLGVYLGGMLVALVLALVLARRMASGLTAPLEALSRTATRIAEDGAASRPADVVGRDEVGQLAAAFNRMLAALRRAQEGLEEQVGERTRELQAALAAMEASERRYRALFSGSQVAMLLIDPADGAIFDANRAAARYYGYDAARLRTMPISAINTLTPEETAEEMRQAREERRNHFFFRHRLASGEIRDVEVHSGPIDQDGRVLLYSIVHDVTDRRRLEDERRRLSIAIEQCTVAIVIADLAGNIEYVNPAFSAVTGYAADEVRGQNPRILKAGDAEGVDYRAMWADLTAGRTWTGVFHNKRKDGGLYWEQAVISPVTDTAGRITHYVAVKQNITERRQAEEAIRSLSRRFQEVLSAASEVAIIATDRDGVITLFNTGARRMLGYTEEEVVGRHTPALFHDAAEVAERMAELTASGHAPMTPFRAFVAVAEREGHERREWTYVSKDGRSIAVSLAVTPVRSESGEVSGYLGVAQDITQRKRAEEALKDSEERFRSLVESTTDWVWETDGEHRFRWFSPSFDAVLGMPADTLLGKRREDLAADGHEIVSTAWMQHFADLRARRPFRDFRYWLRTADGKGRWISISGSPRYGADGAFLGYRGTGSDITERAATSVRMRMLAQVVEQSPVSVVIADTDGHIEYVNERLVQVTGWSRDELMGRHCRIFGSGETPDGTYAELWGAITTGRSWMGELKNRKKDGTPYWEMVAISPVLGEGNEIVRFAGIKEDITYRKEAEARIAEANRLLNQQAIQLQRSNEELEQFAYVASHDLRQPLRAVTNYLALIERALGDSLDEEIQEFIGFATGGATRMDALIRDLLEYSRIGRKERPFEPVPLAEAVADSLLDLDVAIGESNARVTVADGLPTVRGDRIELTRLFQNLIGNAVKYRAPDRDPEVTVDWRDAGDAWVIRVRDNGIGIEAKDFDRAFGVFQRLVTRERYEGTGIGLAVCRKIVDHHGGRIWIESAVGAGSTFLLTLPKAGAVPAAA